MDDHFYRELFCRIDEPRVTLRYADPPPNVPVKGLVGLEFLKAAHGWSDEEMDDAFGCNIQGHYALGYRPLGEGTFDRRPRYSFRERLSRPLQQTGENWLQQVFEQVSGAQLRAF